MNMKESLRRRPVPTSFARQAFKEKYKGPTLGSGREVGEEMIFKGLV